MPKPIHTELPKSGYSRINQLLPFVPFARSTLWRKSKNGEFVKPVKFNGVTAWSNAAVWQWMRDNDPDYQPEAANDPTNLGGAA